MSFDVMFGLIVGYPVIASPVSIVGVYFMERKLRVRYPDDTESAFLPMRCRWWDVYRWYTPFWIVRLKRHWWWGKVFFPCASEAEQQRILAEIDTFLQGDRDDDGD